MKAVILAAGIASRLRPLTTSTPKCLLKIGERNLLERTIDALIENGIEEFVVVTGFLSKQITSFIEEKYVQQRFQFIHNAAFETTNNIYSLYLAQQEVGGQDFLLLDSDIVFDPQIVTALLQHEKENALALNKHKLGEEEIKLIVDEANKVLEISKTCAIDKAIGESIGIEKIGADYSKALFEEMQIMIEQEGLSNVFYERAFERLTSRGHFFYAVDTTQFFSAELDTVEDFRLAQSLLPASLY